MHSLARWRLPYKRFGSTIKDISVDKRLHLDFKQGDTLFLNLTNVVSAANVIVSSSWQDHLDLENPSADNYALRVTKSDDFTTSVSWGIDVTCVGDHAMPLAMSLKVPEYANINVTSSHELNLGLKNKVGNNSILQ